MLSIGRVLVGHLQVLFGKNACSGLLPGFNVFVFDTESCDLFTCCLALTPLGSRRLQMFPPFGRSSSWSQWFPLKPR